MAIFRGWWIVGAGYLTQMLSGAANGWVFGVLVVPMQSDLGWSRTEVVGVITVARLMSGIAGAVLGPIVDRHGARSVMTISALLAAVVLLATSIVQSTWQYYVLWLFFGLALPGLQNIGPGVAISNWFIRKRAQALMILTIGSATAGLVLAPAMAAIADSWSWRYSWGTMG